MCAKDNTTDATASADKYNTACTSQQAALTACCEKNTNPLCVAVPSNLTPRRSMTTPQGTGQPKMEKLRDRLGSGAPRLGQLAETCGQVGFAIAVGPMSSIFCTRRAPALRCG